MLLAPWLRHGCGCSFDNNFSTELFWIKRHKSYSLPFSSTRSKWLTRRVLLFSLLFWKVIWKMSLISCMSSININNFAVQFCLTYFRFTQLRNHERSLYKTLIFHFPSIFFWPSTFSRRPLTCNASASTCNALPWTLDQK